MTTFISDRAMTELCDAIASTPGYCQTFDLLPDPITGFVENYQVEFELGARLDIWRDSARESIEIGQVEALREIDAKAVPGSL